MVSLFQTNIKLENEEASDQCHIKEAAVPSYTIIFFLYILFKIFFLGENLNTNFTFNTKLKGNVGQCQGVCLDRFQTN